MPKVQGPLFSLEAKGSLNKTLTFQKRRGTTAVYQYKKPGDVTPIWPTGAQTVSRLFYFLATFIWNDLDDDSKALVESWARDTGKPMSGFNYIIKLIFEDPAYILEWVSFFPMIELDGNSMYDYFGGDYELQTDNYDPPVTSGIVDTDYKKFPDVFDFEGSQNVLQSTDNPWWDMGTSDMSFGCYFLLRSLPDTYAFLGSKTSGPGAPGYGFFISSTGNIAFLLDDGSTTIFETSSAVIPLNKPNSFVIDFNRSGNCNVYLNGESILSINISSLTGQDITNTEVFSIGGGDQPEETFDGWISMYFMSYHLPAPGFAQIWDRFMRGYTPV